MDRPNVLFIHTDQQRWDALGANGNPDVHTPNLDAMAERGVNVDRHFVNCPLCMPSRASYLTGQYPSQLGIYDNGVPLPEDVRTLPETLAPYGYRSGNLGKLHFLPHANRDHRTTHPSYGFDELEISDEPGPYPDAYRAWVREHDPSALDEISVGLPPAATTWKGDIAADADHPDDRFPKRPVPFGADAGLTHTAFVADRTIDFVERHADDEPFLAVAGFYSPHSPWVVPQRFLDLYDPADLTLPEFPPSAEEEREAIDGSDDPTEATLSAAELRRAHHGYYAMVSEADHHVGRILDRLDDLGIADDTLVVFTSDHGEYLGEHLGYGKYVPTCDAVSRVPLVVQWPSGIDDPGRTVSALTEAADLVPTILDCAGVQVPPNLLGRSFRPVLDGETDAHRDDVLTQHRDGAEVRTDRYWYKRTADGEELYDVRSDPECYHDLADDPAHGAALDEHRTRLLDRLIELDIETGRRPAWHY
jgi:arylsulfatase A-like enzyme